MAKITASEAAIADARDPGEPFSVDAAVAKITASEAAIADARDATQVFCRNGFINADAVARQYRDSQIVELARGRPRCSSW